MFRSTPRRTTTMATSALAALLLFLGACGSDSSDDSDAATEEPTASESAESEQANDGEESADDQAEEDSEDTEDTESAGDGEQGACDLLTEDEIATALGSELESAEGEDASNAVLGSCEWILATPEGEEPAMIPPMLQLVMMDEEEYEFRVSGGEDLYSDLDSLGDAAKWAFVGSEATPDMVQLYVLDSDDAIFLQVGGKDFADEAEAENAMRTLAELVLERR